MGTNDEEDEPDIVKGIELEPNPLTMLPEDEPPVDAADGELDEGDAGHSGASGKVDMRGDAQVGLDQEGEDEI